ncbi:MAG: hypothetical protein OXC95_10930 [Dehalococcoidia bacterium]|nr:hypothetical protein [Dehalococcoidia bacterium]
MRLLLFILFILAFVPQVVLIWDAYWIADMKPDSLLTWIALVQTGVCVVIMAGLAMLTQDIIARWLSVGLIGVVALAFSALTIVSLGLLIGPIALALIVLSLVMLIRNRHSAAANS